MADFISVDSYTTYNAVFSASIVQTAPEIYSDVFDVEVDFLWSDTNLANGNASFMKMKYFLEDSLHQSILTHPHAPMIFSNVENNIVLFPCVPTNDVIAMTLHAKLNTIVGDHIEIISVKVGSRYANPRLTYTYSDAEYSALPSLKEFINLDPKEYYYDRPWWFRNDTVTYEYDISEDKDLTDPPESDTILNEIEKLVIGELKLQTEGGEVVNINAWKPEIVKD